MLPSVLLPSSSSSGAELPSPAPRFSSATLHRRLRHRQAVLGQPPPISPFVSSSLSSSSPSPHPQQQQQQQQPQQQKSSAYSCMPLAAVTNNVQKTKHHVITTTGRCLHQVLYDRQCHGPQLTRAYQSIVALKAALRQQEQERRQRQQQATPSYEQQQQQELPASFFHKSKNTTSSTPTSPSTVVANPKEEDEVEVVVAEEEEERTRAAERETPLQTSNETLSSPTRRRNSDAMDEDDHYDNDRVSSCGDKDENDSTDDDDDDDVDDDDTDLPVDPVRHARGDPSFEPRSIHQELVYYVEYISSVRSHSAYLHHLGGREEIQQQLQQQQQQQQQSSNMNSSTSTSTNNMLNSNQHSSLAVSTISVAFSHDAQTLASTHGDHTVKISCCGTGKLLQTLDGHPRTPWTVKYHPFQSDIVASGCLGHQVRVWNWKFKQCLQMVRLEYAIISLSFHPSGKMLAVANGTRLNFWGVNSATTLSPSYSRSNSTNSNNASASNAHLRSNDNNNNSSSSSGSSPPLTEIDQRHMLRCVHFPPDGKTLIIGGVNTNPAPPTSQLQRQQQQQQQQQHQQQQLPPPPPARSARPAGGSGSSSSGGSPMSFYLRLWDFHLAIALNPVVYGEGTTITLRPISNPRTFVPRALLYNDGGFDVSPDGKTLCACVEYWLPDGVDNAMDLIHKEEEEEERRRRQAEKLVRKTEREQRRWWRRRQQEQQQQQRSRMKTTTALDGTCESSDDLSRLQQHSQNNHKKSRNSHSDTSVAAAAATGLTATTEIATSNAAATTTSTTLASSPPPLLSAKNNLGGGRWSPPVSQRSMSCGSSSSNNNSAPTTPKLTRPKPGLSSVPHPPLPPPLQQQQQSLQIVQQPQQPTTNMTLSPKVHAPRTPEPLSNSSPSLMRLSPPPPPGRRFWNVGGGQSSTTRPNFNSQSRGAQRHQTNAVATTTTTTTETTPVTSPIAGLTEQQRQQGSILNESQRFRLDGREVLLSSTSGSGIGGVPSSAWQQHQQQPPPPLPPGSSSSSTTTRPVATATGIHQTIRPPHPLSSVTSSTYPEQYIRNGRYVPHVVTISLDTTPVSPQFLPPSWGGNGSGTTGVAPSAGMMVSGVRSKPYPAVALGYRSRLGQILEACPLDAGKASAVTCVKFSPSTEFCLIGYGVRVPVASTTTTGSEATRSSHDTTVGDGAATTTSTTTTHASNVGAIVAANHYSHYHPVTAVYRIRGPGGMSQISTLLSRDDDVNIARFHPVPGHGFVYGAKQGRLRVVSTRPWMVYHTDSARTDTEEDDDIDDENSNAMLTMATT